MCYVSLVILSSAFLEKLIIKFSVFTEGILSIHPTMSKFQGIPKFYHTQSSPIVQDSAFPPFNIDYKYRGVYERAGFDIYKLDKNERFNDTASRTRKSPDKYGGSKDTSYGRSASSQHSIGSGNRSRPSHYKNNQSSTSLNNSLVSPISGSFPYGAHNGKYSASNPSFASHPAPYHHIHSGDAKNYSSCLNLPNDSNGYSRSNISVSRDQEISPTESSFQNYSHHSVNSHPSSSTSSEKHRQNLSDNLFADPRVSELEATTPISISHDQNSLSEKPSASMNPQYPTHNHTGSRFLFHSDCHSDQFSQNTHANDSLDFNQGRNFTSETVNPSHPMYSVPGESSHQVTEEAQMSGFQIPSRSESRKNSNDTSFGSASIGSTPFDPDYPPRSRNRSIQSQEQFDPRKKSFSTQLQERFDPRKKATSALSQEQQDLRKKSSSTQSYEQFDPRKKSVSSGRKKSTDQLSSALADLTQDVHNHNLSNSIQSDVDYNFKQPADVPYPTEERFSYGNDISSKPDHLFKQFQSKQLEQTESLNTDYQNFLTTKSGSDDNNQRNSAMTMVSSILSKDSAFSNEDDEVEQELQTQLETLKINAGKDLAIDSPSVQQNPIVFPGTAKDNISEKSIDVGNDDKATYHSNHNYVSLAPSEFVVPSIEINGDETPVDSSRSSHISGNTNSLRSETSEEASTKDNVPYPVDESVQSGVRSNSVGMDDLDELSSEASYETVEPLFVRHSHVGYNKYGKNVEGNVEDDSTSIKTVKFSDPIPENVQTPRIHIDNENFDSPRSNHSFNDSVKPLSPKNHEVEAELEGINFRISDADGSPSQFMNQEFSNQTSQGIEEQTFYPPGEGPCRSCNYSIIPGSKGSQKAIFSKTGELSGQWHRSCFACSYDGCGISFNKHVQCYALDNFPYCHHHYHLLNNTLCEACSLGIEGECIENELEQKWHLQCLKCQKCHDLINTDYYLINGNIFCERDASSIINDKQRYTDSHGQVKGLSGQDRIEKRRTRVLFLD